MSASAVPAQAGDSRWKWVVGAAKAVSSRRFTVRRGDGARPCRARAYLALMPAPRQRRLVGQAPSWPIPCEQQARLPLAQSTELWEQQKTGINPAQPSDIARKKRDAEPQNARTREMRQLPAKSAAITPARRSNLWKSASKSAR